MSRKEVLEPVYITATGATPLFSPTNGINSLNIPTQSLSASFNTVSTSVKYVDNFSYQINLTTSSSMGTFELQGCNDNVNFSNVMPCGVVNAANDEILVNINQWPFAYIRLAYTSTTAGTGTCTIIASAKSLGA